MITLQRARELLRQAVDTQGDAFAYAPSPGASCHYTVEDFARFYRTENDGQEPLATDPRLKTGCLVGVVLGLAGFTEHHGVEAGVDDDIALPIPMEPEARAYLSAAQQSQDIGHTWGEAFVNAEGLVEELLDEMEVRRDYA